MNNRRIIGITNEVLSLVRNYSAIHGLTEIHAPRITNCAGACEDINTLMPLEYYGIKGYLAQTSQPFLEYCVAELDRVYAISRCFRLEKKISPRHLSEFTHIEMEMQVDGLSGLLTTVEGFISNLVKKSSTNYGGELVIERITYDEAINFLNMAGGSKEWGIDFTAREENAITEWIGGPVFVTNFPSKLKSFTFKLSDERKDVVDNADLLVPSVGELLSVGMRESSPDKLQSAFRKSPQSLQMNAHKIPTTEYDWYFALKKTQQDIVTGGWGMGLERFVMWNYGIQHIYDATLLHRAFQSPLSP